MRDQFSETVLGQIPEIKAFQEDADIHLLSEENPDSHALVESFRNLRSSIIFSYPDGKHPGRFALQAQYLLRVSTIAVTWLSLATGNSRVLLVDGISAVEQFAKFGFPHSGLVSFCASEVSAERLSVRQD